MIIGEEIDYTKFKIVILDHDENSRSDLLGHLSASGFKVVGTDDPDEVLRLAKNGEVDLIVSEIFMPKTTGFQLAKTINSKIPIILMSDNDCEEIDREIADLSDAFINKTIEREQLVLAVKKVIKRWKINLS